MCSAKIAHVMRRVFISFGSAAALSWPVAASAQPPMLAAVLMVQSAQTSVAMASPSSLCININYDKNGNRVSQTVGNVTTSTTIWGAATYGCFVWKP
jgi:hypothetical protein